MPESKGHLSRDIKNGKLMIQRVLDNPRSNQTTTQPPKGEEDPITRQYPIKPFNNQVKLSHSIYPPPSIYTKQNAFLKLPKHTLYHSTHHHHHTMPETPALPPPPPGVHRTWKLAHHHHDLIPIVPGSWILL